jgi:hypothetical protein
LLSAYAALLTAILAEALEQALLMELEQQQQRAAAEARQVLRHMQCLRLLALLVRKYKH